jgi:hypothetical protein
MRGSQEWHLGEVRQTKIGPAQRECPRATQPAKNRRHLEIDDLWRSECLPGEPTASLITVRTVINESSRDNAGINDDHGPPSPPQQ